MLKVLCNPKFYSWETKEEFNQRVTEGSHGAYNVTKYAYECEVY